MNQMMGFGRPAPMPMMPPLPLQREPMSGVIMPDEPPPTQMPAGPNDLSRGQDAQSPEDRIRAILQMQRSGRW